MTAALQDRTPSTCVQLSSVTCPAASCAAEQHSPACGSPDVSQHLVSSCSQVQRVLSLRLSWLSWELVKDFGLAGC